MNKDQFQGHFQQLRGKIKEKWGKLTDDEIDQIQGRWEQLIGKLQAKYGISRDKAEMQLEEFMRNIHMETTPPSGRNQRNKPY